MAQQSAGDTYRVDHPAPKKKKVSRRQDTPRTDAQKRAARTTPSSRARFDANHPRHGGGGGGGGGGGHNDPLLDDPGYFQQPLTLRGANQEANRLVNARYGQQEANVSPYFQAYRDQVGQGAAQVTQAYAPVVQGSQQREQVAAQVAPGTEAADPNSQASKDAQMAALSREALQHAFTTVLQGNQAADESYFAGRAGPVAAAAELGMKRDIAAGKGEYRAELMAGYRESEHKRQLENAAFNVDQYKAETDRKSDRADRANDRRDDRAKNNEVNAYGYSKKAWAALTPDQRRKIMADVKAEQRPPKAPKKPDGKDRFGNTRVQRRASTNAWQGGLSFLQSQPSILASPAAITAVQTEADVPYDIAKIIVSRLRKGYLTKAQAHKLQRLGVKFDYKTVKRGKSYEDRVSDNEAAGPPAP